MTQRAFKLGYGYDSHRFLNAEEKRMLQDADVVEDETEHFARGKQLIIGGVVLDEQQQRVFGPFKARSDGDVLYHAVVNALLSALGNKEMRDIGTVFPNRDATNSNRSSSEFLHHAAEALRQSDYELLDLKIMVKGRPRVDWKQVEQNLAAFFSFQSAVPEIHVQATTGEEMDGAGNGLGVEVFVVTLLQHKRLTVG